MSSPAVTGVVALILQSNPNLTPAQVKEIIIETARTDDKTGDLTDSVSVRWGHGKIDAREAIKRALELVSINPIASTESFLIYPNPAQNKIFIDYKEEGFVNISLYSIDGKCMLEKVNTMDKELNVGHLPKGVYLLKMQTKTAPIKFRWVLFLAITVKHHATVCTWCVGTCKIASWIFVSHDGS